jgi:hypothetical protein
MSDDDSLRISGLFDYSARPTMFFQNAFLRSKHTVTGLELFESFGDRVLPVRV